MIKKILIANRAEIAVRIIRTAKKLGIRSVAVYSQVDRDALHVSMADEVVCIGEIELSDTYLNIGKLIEVALSTGCDAIHPGYGFLAENPLFPDACEEAGIIFIGPTGKVMRTMGNKISAREFVKNTGVPITSGVTGKKEELLDAGKRIGLPVLLKAAAGGGGKGMRIVHHENELEEAIESTARQAKAYFGDETVYIEKYLENPRHIEFQILGDHHGNVIHLFERECSIQRRYQKIIEESPSPTLTPEIRAGMGAASVKIGKEIGYTNAGTIEFLVDKDLNFYFLEMNTRIQVEHPVTELVTGIDMVEEQIRIAEGKELTLKQADILQRGHAIECRIYAENPEHDFQPSPGHMTLYREPEGPCIRIDKGIRPDTEIKSTFDPMISKLITWGNDRDEAITRMGNALSEYIIHGIKTNIAYLQALVHHPAFLENKISTGFCDLHTKDIIAGIHNEKNKINRYLPLTGYLACELSGKHNGNSQVIGAENIWDETGFWRNSMNIRVQFENEEILVDILKIKKDRIEFRIADTLMMADTIVRRDHKVAFTINGSNFTAWVSENKEHTASITFQGQLFTCKRMDILTESEFASGPDLHGSDHNHVCSPMPGKVIKVEVKEGEEVRKGALLMIVEAMKMENKIVSPANAIISEIRVKINDRVEADTALILFDKIE
ncbi:MAG: acetyl-CoA carboxylase biotin carboxylase subunit [Bacteroidetes bacterium]|nr:acetyl-CoA carboxylase biotin carboxylase subunit [Bacteroidota bacterium]